MKHINHRIIFFVSCLFIQTFLWATYDPTLTGYGTAVAYQGKHVDCFLDVTADTNEGTAASPYGIVTTGSCLLNTSALPNYPTGLLQSLPSVSRFNRDGTKDTNFGNFFPGTGWYTNDPSTGNLYPSFFPGSSRTGKLVYMNAATSSPIYFWLLRNGATQTTFSLRKYLPLTGRLDLGFGTSGTQSLGILNEVGGSAGSVTVTSACTVPVSGGQTNPQTTLVMYVTYYDVSGNSYIAALKYSLTGNSFSYDTTGFNASQGVVKLPVGVTKLNSINYDSTANAGAGALIVSGYAGGNVIIARYTTAGVLDTTFNSSGTPGYAIVAAPGSATVSVISQYVFSKIVSGTQYYYCAGYNSGGPEINVCYFNPSTAAFVSVGGLVATIGVTGNPDPYTIYDMVQIPDSSNTKAVAIAVGYSGSATAGIINFQFEAPAYDWNNVNEVAITDVDSSDIFESGNLAFYTCLFDPTLYAPSPQDLPGVVVAGNLGTNGCFINYTYGTEPSGSTTEYGMIPAQGVGSGVGFLDYTTATYPGGFSCEQVFYSSASGGASYYVVLEGLNAPNTDSGIVRFDLGDNSFDYTFSGTSGNPFCLIAANVAPSVSALDTTDIVYTAGVATAGTSFVAGDLVLTAFDLTSETLVSTFSRDGMGDGGIIPYPVSTFTGLGGTSFAQLDLALQDFPLFGAQTKIIVAGTNNLAIPGFVARFNTTPTAVGDGVLDLSFGAPRGYNIFNPLGNTCLSACAVDTVQNVIVAGSVGSGDALLAGQLVVARYTKNGILDTHFGPAPQVGYGYFTLLGLSGTGYGISVNDISFDPGTNMYVVGQYTAPLATNSAISSTSPFISRVVSLGVQDSTFYNNYGTFLIPLQYVNGAGIFQKCLYDIVPISNLSSSTMYAIGYINETVNAITAPFATLIRFSIQGLNLTTSQGLNSGTVSTTPLNIQGNICVDLTIPPIYFVSQISSPQGPGSYTFNGIKTSSDVQNILNLPGILYELNNDLIDVGATTDVAEQIVANFKNLMEILIDTFVDTYPGLLLTNILFLSQAIATNECLLVNNGKLIVYDTNQLQVIYAAESILQNNIKIAASYCTNTLISPYN